MYQPEFKMIWPSSVRDLSDAKKTDSSKGLVIRKVRLIAEFFESIVWLLLLLKRYSKSEVSNSWAIFLPDNSVMILLAILGVLMVAFKKMRPSLGVGNFAMFTKESFTVMLSLSGPRRRGFSSLEEWRSCYLPNKAVSVQSLSGSNWARHRFPNCFQSDLDIQDGAYFRQ